MEYLSYSVLSYSVNSDALWHAHRQLSASPDSTSRSRAGSSKVSFGVNALKRSFIKLLLNELDSDQQIQYLERCLALDTFHTATKPTSFLSRVWQLLQ
jgi:hypothetical protein